MASNVVIGFGTLLQRGAGDGPPETFTTIGEVIEITPPNPSRDSVETTHTSNADRFRTFIPGMIDGGEMTAEINYVPGSTADDNLQTDLNASSVKNYKVLFASGESIIVPAFITGIEPGVPIDDRMTASVTFKVAGKPTYS